MQRPFAFPVQGEVGGGRRSEGLWVLPNGGRTYIFASAVNPSVSLTADSSPCTGEPGSRLTRGGATIPARLVCTDRGAFADKEIIFSVAARLSGALP